MRVTAEIPDTLRSVVAAPDSIAMAVSQDQPQAPMLAEGSIDPVQLPPASLSDALAPPRSPGMRDPRDPRQHAGAGEPLPNSPEAVANMPVTGGEPTRIAAVPVGTITLAPITLDPDSGGSRYEESRTFVVNRRGVAALSALNRGEASGVAGRGDRPITQAITLQIDETRFMDFIIKGFPKRAKVLGLIR